MNPEPETVEVEVVHGAELAVRPVTTPASFSDFVPQIRRTPEEVKDNLQRIAAVVKDYLRPGVDFDTIPGTGKPSLLQPGAERLGQFFSFFSTSQLVEKEQDFDTEPPYLSFTYRVSVGPLSADGKIVPISTMEGTANSWEDKWRWRQARPTCPDCGKATVIHKKAGGWFCGPREGGCGHGFKNDDTRLTSQKAGRVPNEDVYSLVNTIRMIAQKRGYVAAMKRATATSEFFTQDMEDFRPAEEPAPAAPKAATKATLKKLQEMADAADLGEAVTGYLAQHEHVSDEWAQRQIKRINDVLEKRSADSQGDDAKEAAKEPMGDEGHEEPADPTVAGVNTETGELPDDDEIPF